MSTAAVATSTVTFGSLIDASGTTQAQLAAHLDALDAQTRAEEMRALSAKQQKRLWELCEGAPAFTLDELVPPSLGEGKPVHFAGKNSLAAFTLFEKRFMRWKGEIVGYNQQTMGWFTGPGYYTSVQSPKDAREILFDYTRVPAEQPPAGWPPVKPNTGVLSKLVYGGLHDFNRRVSRDVLIGYATRNGKPLESYYVLSRL